MPEPSSPLTFSILGPLEVRSRGEILRIPTRRQRALLVLLLMEAGHPVPFDRLIDQLWDGSPPPQAPVTLRSYVSNLRQSLRGSDGADVIATRGHGYSINVSAATVDASMLETLTGRGRAEMAGGDAHAARATFSEATRLWRGQPLAEIADHESAQALIARVTELHRGAQEGLFEALLATGGHLDALPSLEAFVAQNPLRETPRAQLMLALHRAGRAPEALAVHDQFRALLGDELGLDPSAKLAQLRQGILTHAPELDIPEATIRVGGAPASGEPPGSPVPHVAVVGRHDELRVLEGLVGDIATDGHGSLLLVSGEPGIGKTTLLDALLEIAHRQGVTAHIGRYPSAAGVPPFWPWSRVMRSTAAALTDDELELATSGAAAPVTQLVPEIAARLGHRHEISSDNALGMRFVLYDAMTAFLTRAAAIRPLVVVVDDLHWADVPSMEMLSYLAPHLAGSPLLVATAYRDLASERSEELSATLATVSREDVVREVRLRGLSAEEVAELATDLVSVPPSPQVATALYERTGGNPFFVRQLSRLFEGPAADDRDLPSERSGLPPGLRHVLLRRLDVLDDGPRRLMDAAALMGREFDLRVVAHACDVELEVALSWLDASVEHGIAEPDTGSGTRFRLVHALIQEVLVEELPPGREALLHARIASALEGLGGAVGQLAEHLWRAGDLVGDDRPLSYALAAAREATDLFAYEQAETYLRRALSMARRLSPRDPPTELGVSLHLFQVMSITRGWGSDEARDLVVAAGRLAGSGALSSEHVHLWWGLWTSLLDRDESAAADEAAATLLAHATDSGDPVALTAAHIMSAFTCFSRPGDMSSAMAHLASARVAADRSDPQQLATFPENLGVMLLLIEAHAAAFLGDERAAALNEEAIALADSDGRSFPRAMSRTFAAVSSVLIPSPDRALAHADGALRLCQEFGFHWLALLTSSAHAWAGAHLGESPLPHARTLASAVAEIRASGRHGSASHVLLMQAQVLRLTGDVTGARQTLVEARAVPGAYAGLMLRRIDAELAEIDGLIASMDGSNRNPTDSQRLSASLGG